MKLLVLLFLSLSAFAEDCRLFELKGEVKDKQGVTLTINKGSNSEKVFIVAPKIELQFAPWLNKFVQGKYVVKNNQIVAIEKTEMAVPDPLSHYREMIFLKNQTCP